MGQCAEQVMVTSGAPQLWFITDPDCLEGLACREALYLEDYLSLGSVHVALPPSDQGDAWPPYGHLWKHNHGD